MNYSYMKLLKMMSLLIVSLKILEHHHCYNSDLCLLLSFFEVGFVARTILFLQLRVPAELSATGRERRRGVGRSRVVKPQDNT